MISMRRANIDIQKSEHKACVQILAMLEAIIVEVVDNNQQPNNFDQIQFKMFTMARNAGATYVECREIVEWSNQLIFSFWDANSTAALATLKAMRAWMLSDENPSWIVTDIIRLLVNKNVDKYNAERISATVSNFLQCFIDDKQEKIVYM